MRVSLPFQRRAPAATSQNGALHAGLCNICGSRDGFSYSEAAHPRENFACLGCASTSRDRMLIKTLGNCLGLVEPLAEWPRQGLRLMETSGFRATPALLAAKFDYLNLMYEGRAANSIQGDLSRLGLQDASLDFLLTSDVFEHVREDEPAWQEVYRVLKPGATLILQVPALGEFQATQVRVEVRDGEDVYLMEPEYHAEHTLVYRYYGRDLLDHLVSIGFAVLAFRGRYPEHCISEQTVVVAQKAAYVSMGPREINDRAWS
jgi:SAM-dependent methyltransferase